MRWTWGLYCLFYTILMTSGSQFWESKTPRPYGNQGTAVFGLSVAVLQSARIHRAFRSPFYHGRGRFEKEGCHSLGGSGWWRNGFIQPHWQAPGVDVFVCFNMFSWLWHKAELPNYLAPILKWLFLFQFFLVDSNLLMYRLQKERNPHEAVYDYGHDCDHLWICFDNWTNWLGKLDFCYGKGLLIIPESTSQDLMDGFWVSTLAAVVFPFCLFFSIVRDIVLLSIDCGRRRKKYINGVSIPFSDTT